MSLLQSLPRRGSNYNFYVKGIKMDEMCRTEGGDPMINLNSLSQKLSRERGRIESRLAEIKKAEDLLNSEPKLKDLFDAIARIGHL
jgi:hypothetical protein